MNKKQQQQTATWLIIALIIGGAVFAVIHYDIINQLVNGVSDQTTLEAPVHIKNLANVQLNTQILRDKKLRALAPALTEAEKAALQQNEAGTSQDNGSGVVKPPTEAVSDALIRHSDPFKPF